MSLTNYALPGERPHPRYRVVAIEVARQAIRVYVENHSRGELLDQVLDEELLHVAERTLGPGYSVRDYGLLEAALARPRATPCYGLNGRRLTFTNDAADELIISVASGQLDTADAIAAVLQTATGPRK